jgi:hypothetical protein
MARDAAMGDIDQYISDAKQNAAPASPPIDTSAPADAVMAPEVEPNTTGVRVQQESAPLEDEEQERASIREMRAAQVLADRQRAEESELARTARQAIETGSDAVRSTQDIIKAQALRVGSVIGGVPIPGDILLPLSILLLFFFVLIAVNGHTRLMWLWLTLTGNASLATGSGTVTTPSGLTPAQVPSSITQPGTVVGTLSTRSLAPLSNTLQPLPQLPTANGLFGGLATFATGVEDFIG